MSCSFQTVFEIVVAVEGLSIWQGRFLDGRRSFVGLERPAFDAARHNALCDEAREHPERLLPALRLFAAGVWRRLRGPWLHVRRALGWLFYMVYKALAFLLRASPLVTVPFLAVSYLAQWHCRGDDFDFRHFFRTQLARAGVSDDVAMRLGGWTQRETAARYDHDDHREQLAAAIEAAWKV